VSRRLLIVNADDFGRSPGLNRGVARAHEYGIVTSASLMVCFPAAADAAEYARTHPDLSVGLHIDLVTDGEWRPTESFPRDGADRVAKAASEQLAAFRELVGGDPTHVDSHQHVHRVEPARSITIELARELGVPLREFDPRVWYAGQFYGQGAGAEPIPEAISVAALVALLRDLRPGVTELGCHPAEGADFPSTYSAERPRELEALCDLRVRAAIEQEGIELISFRELPSVVTRTNTPSGQ
jgi:predicted glycoside hydrolase/deacetylase ChbG (UPF0249 family)